MFSPPFLLLLLLLLLELLLLLVLILLLLLLLLLLVLFLAYCYLHYFLYVHHYFRYCKKAYFTRFAFTVTAPMTRAFMTYDYYYTSPFLPDKPSNSFAVDLTISSLPVLVD